MLYLSGVVRPELARVPNLGFMRTPNIGNTYRGGVWAADSGCFNVATYKGDRAYLDWLSDQPRDECLFATAPDVVGDHNATVLRSTGWDWTLRALRYQCAFVLQDGATVDTVPWDWDWYFIGGTTEFKLGQAARDLTAEAIKRGKRVHMGRVNSEKRLRYAHHIGCTSADGTLLAFGPDIHLPRIEGWLRGIRDQLTLS